MVPPLHRFSGGVYRVPTKSVRRPARPPGTAIGEMNPVQGMSWRPKPVSIRCMIGKARSPDMVGPVKPGGQCIFLSTQAVSTKCPRRTRAFAPDTTFPLKGSSLQALPPPAKRRTRPRRDVTTVDQSDIRVLDNALYDPSGASSLYMAGVHATNGRAQGWDEDSPDPYTRRGLAPRFAGPGHHSANSFDLTTVSQRGPHTASRISPIGSVVFSKFMRPACSFERSRISSMKRARFSVLDEMMPSWRC